MFNPSETQAKSLLPKGHTLNGRYQIDHYLSSGGFGNTYYALDTQLSNKVVAIKEFFVSGVTHRESDQCTVSVSNVVNTEQFEKLRKKFHEEAQRMAKLGDSDHICNVTDLFEENGTSYYAMQYIDGLSLKDCINKNNQPLPESEARVILQQVLDALSDIHSKGIYHLDIKPANIMLNKKHSAVLIDFGASKIVRDDKEASQSASALCYTPGYAPTEQVFQDFNSFGPWTDFYALGATIYKIISMNELPNASELLDVEDSRTVYKFPYYITQEMREMIFWLMQPKRKDRPMNVDEILSKRGDFFSPMAIAQLQQQEKDGFLLDIIPEAKEVLEGEGLGEVIDLDDPEPGNPEGEQEGKTEVNVPGGEGATVVSGGLSPENEQQEPDDVPIRPVMSANQNNRRNILIVLGVTLACAIIAALVYWFVRRDHFASPTHAADSTAVDSVRTDSAKVDTATAPAPTPAPTTTAPATNVQQPTTAPQTPQPTTNTGNQNNTSAGNTGRVGRNNSGNTGNVTNPGRSSGGKVDPLTGQPAGRSNVNTSSPSIGGGKADPLSGSH